MAKALKDLIVGARVCDKNTKYYGSPIVWKIIEHNHIGDPENSTAIISEKVLCLKAYDAKEPKNPDSNIQKNGNGSYIISNILQWANSDADAWTWYAPQHEYDHPPDTIDYVTDNPYESEAGFLNGFSSGFKENMLEVTKKIGTEVARKVHILTRKELGIDNALFDDESLSPYEFFSDAASRKADITKEATEKDSGKYYGYWTAENSNYSVHIVIGDSGYGGGDYEHVFREANIGNDTGFRPFCCLNSDAIVSEKPDENGVYTLILKSNPEKPDGPETPSTPMDGTWRTPKTNWTKNDAFNLKDYKRIRNNLLFLRNKISDIWREFEIKDMGNDPSDPRYIWKVQYFNAIEENLETINKHVIIVKNYGYKQTFYNNGVFIGFSELNRIENGTLQMKRIIDGWEAGLRRLSFRLGSPKGLYL